MKFTTPKNHVFMHTPYTLKDFGSNPANVANSWSTVYMSKPQMGSGKVNKYGMVQSGYNQFSRVDSGTLTYPFTWCAWLKKFAHTDTSYPIFMSYGLPYMACNGSTSPFRFSYLNQAGSQANLQGTTIPSLAAWYHVCVTDDGTTIKLYVNGQLEDSSTDNMRSQGSTNAAFEIGRHYQENNYRIHGAVDDIRLYDVALEQTEIQAIANMEKDERTLEITDSGDVIVNQYIEEDYDWKLWANFGSYALDPYSWHESNCGYIINPTGIFLRNTATLDADGWTRYLTTIDTSQYTRYRGYMQFFYSGTPIGYIQKSLPFGYSRLRVRWGNWYSGTSYLDLNGVNKQTIGSGGGGRDYEVAISGGELLRFRESGITWPGEIWVGNSKTYSGGLIEDKADFKFVKNTNITDPRIVGTTLEYPGNLIVR